MQNKDSGGIPDDFLPSLMKALDEIASIDPDKPISEESRRALKTFLEISEDENKKFLEGNFAMNPSVMKNVHRAAMLFKRLEKEGSLSAVEIHVEPGIGPACVKAESKGFVLIMEDKSDFADIIESSGNYEIEPSLTGTVSITVSFPGLWTKVCTEVGNEPR